MDEILRVSNITKSYGGKTVVEDVSFVLHRGEHLGISGKSGAGKTTLVKSLLHLITPDSGSVIFHGNDLLLLKGRKLRKARLAIQMIPQNPGTTLNERMNVRDIVLEGARYNHLVDRNEDEYLAEIIESVSLRNSDLGKRPGEFSGGEKARIAIARALALRPDILICDEITASLDASLKSGILTLLESLDASLIVISHDRMALEYISDRILYIEGGRIYDSNSR